MTAKGRWIAVIAFAFVLGIVFGRTIGISKADALDLNSEPTRLCMFRNMDKIRNVHGEASGDAPSLSPMVWLRIVCASDPNIRG